MPKPETKPVKITAKIAQSADALYSRAFFEQMLYASGHKVGDGEFDAQFCLDQVRRITGQDPVAALHDLGIIAPEDVEIELSFLDEETGKTTTAKWAADDDDDG